jgi:capsular polysaccharide biosynthesis protein
VLDSNFLPVGMHNPYITPRLLALIQAKKNDVTPIDDLAFFADSFTPNNYCHFVVDHLPRILWMQQLSGAKTFGAFEIAMSKYQKAYFKLVKIKPKNMLSLQRHKLYSVKKLKVMNTSGTDFMHCFNGGNDEYAKPVMELAELPIVQKQKVKTSKKIALVRPKELGRSFTNNDEVVSALKKTGFDLIDPGKYSVVEQIAMMQRADFVLGIHGAALTNIVFCKPGTKVLEIFPPLYGTLAFYTISLAANLDYDVCVGKSDATALSIGAAGRLDFELPLDTLNNALLRFEGK